MRVFSAQLALAFAIVMAGCALPPAQHEVPPAQFLSEGLVFDLLDTMDIETASGSSTYELSSSANTSFLIRYTFPWHSGVNNPLQVIYWDDTNNLFIPQTLASEYELREMDWSKPQNTPASVHAGSTRQKLGDSNSNVYLLEGVESHLTSATRGYLMVSWANLQDGASIDIYGLPATVLRLAHETSEVETLMLDDFTPAPVAATSAVANSVRGTAQMGKEGKSYVIVIKVSRAYGPGELQVASASELRSIPLNSVTDGPATRYIFTGTGPFSLSVQSNAGDTLAVHALIRERPSFVPATDAAFDEMS